MFFQEYWSENKLNAFQNSTDLEYLSRLPESIVSEIIVDYLFKDFKYKYNSYLFPRNNKKDFLKNRGQHPISELKLMKFLRDTSSVRDNEFLIQFVKDLEPRFFNT